FVLDMGEPVRIYELARNMIQLSGLTVRDACDPDGDIEIRVIGLRAGENPYAEMLIANDPKPTPHPRIMKAPEPYLPWSDLEQQLGALSVRIDTGDVLGARQLLRQLVPEYTPSVGPMDWVTLERGALEKRDAVELDRSHALNTAERKIAVVK